MSWSAFNAETSWPNSTQLDEALGRAAPRIALDASFDRVCSRRVDAIDESQKAAARRRVEEELHENLRALSRGWRRTLAFVLPGVIAGIALAFTLTGYFLSADATQPLVEGAENLARGNAGLVHLLITTILGASIGAGVARWLASVAE